MKTFILVFALIFSSFLLRAQTGTLDDSFNIGDGPSSSIETIAIQSDGKILIGGLFTSYNGTSINRLARLNSDGSLDNSFDIGVGPSGVVHKIKVLENGKIFIAGSISRYNNQDCEFIVKLNSDGSRDTSFTVIHNSNQSSPAYDFHVLPDGKILLVGILNDFAESGQRTLVRLNSDGSHDTTFNVGGSGFEGNVPGVIPVIRTIDTQSDGKIIVGGFFYKYNGTISRFLSRLNPDGSHDTTFQNGNTVFSGPSNEINTLKVLDDDKILVGGENASYNGDTVNFLMRLNSDGSLDNTFNHGTGNTPYELAVGENGEIAIGGSGSGGIYLHESNGLQDDDFFNGRGSGTNTRINSCAIQEDGKILIGGTFSTFDGTPVNKLARINVSSTLGINDAELNVSTTKIYPNPSNSFIHISSIKTYSEYLIYSLNGKKIKSGSLERSLEISINYLNNGVYYLELIGKENKEIIKFIKE
jgi:uncharacterized delta-60 repeat protein